jgi:hypothetical protein
VGGCPYRDQSVFFTKKDAVMNSSLLDRLFLQIGTGFTTEAYMAVTRFQGILWSISDILIIFILLKIVSLIKGQDHRKRILIQYLLLWISAIIVPFLIFIKDPSLFFKVESVIFGLQFIVLIYTVIADSRDIMNYFKKIVRGYS